MSRFWFIFCFESVFKIRPNNGVVTSSDYFAIGHRRILFRVLLQRFETSLVMITPSWPTLFPVLWSVNHYINFCFELFNLVFTWTCIMNYENVPTYSDFEGSDLYFLYFHFFWFLFCIFIFLLKVTLLDMCFEYLLHIFCIFIFKLYFYADSIKEKEGKK